MSCTPITIARLAVLMDLAIPNHQVFEMMRLDLGNAPVFPKEPF